MLDTDQIMPGLYLGGIVSVTDLDCLQKSRITHILTLLDHPLPLELSKHFTYKFLYLLDLCDSDLLNILTGCLQFITNGMQNGGHVFVHCQAGISRSAAVVTAFIMKKFRLSTLAAFNLVRKHRPVVKPNDGFLYQLDLFHLMEWLVDKQHPEYIRFMLRRVAVRHTTEPFDSSTIPECVYHTCPPPNGQISHAQHYKCRKCRLILFDSSALNQHVRGEGESAFYWCSKVVTNQQQAATGDICNQSLFVEPIEWMKCQIENVEGKLSCPKCSSKLGSFVWHGERCPCGAWVAPAFHIQTGKVDVVKPTASLLHHISVPHSFITRPPTATTTRPPTATSTNPPTANGT